jgi:TPR repeat protein
MRAALFVLALTLAACNINEAANEKAVPDSRRYPMSLDIPATLKEQLAFTCAHEKDHLPPLDPDADLLFKHARWLQKHNLLKNDPLKYPEYERLYRIAAAHGHYKASHNLTLMHLRGETPSNDYVSLPVDLAEQMIAQGIPKGYYDMGLLLNSGHGVVADSKAMLQYFRKAADLGDPEAQYYVGNKLANLGIGNPVPYRIGLAMLRCAGEQGHGEAAKQTGINLMRRAQDKEEGGSFTDALKLFQIGVKAGNNACAHRLESAFYGVPADNQVFYLGLEKDEERSRRYEILNDILGKASYLQPTVDDIDEIVPLPPAKLPPWDGEIKWLKEWDKGIPPPLPSEERIAEMAREKGLDPATGYKLPPPPEPKAEAPPPPPPPSRHAATGDPCPRSGLWCSIQNPQKVVLEKGQPMPEVAYNLRSANPLGRLLGLRRTVMAPGHWEWLKEAPRNDG